MAAAIVPTASVPARVTTRRVLRAEWLKFTSVRSNVVALAVTAAAVVFLGAMFASLAGSDVATGPAAASDDPLRLSLSGFNIAQLVVGVLGVLVASSEYSSGLIRTTFSAVTNRARVVGAKAAVIGAVVFVVGTVTAFAAYLAGSATYAGSLAVPGLGDAGVVRAVLGMGGYLAGIAAIGVAMGFLLRSTGAAVGVLVVALLIVPGLARLVPGEVGEFVARLLPSNAGAAFSNAAITMGGGDDLLSAPAGLLTFAGWAVGAVVLAALTVRRRDA